MQCNMSVKFFLFLYIAHEHFTVKKSCAKKTLECCTIVQFHNKIVNISFYVKYCKQMCTTTVPKTSLWYYASSVGFCWQSVWSLRLIYSCRGQIYTNYRTLTIATSEWLTQSHKGTMHSPYGTSTRSLAITSSVLFLRSLPLLVAVY
jgi:hypothetical protein